MFLSDRTPAELAQGLGINPKEVGGKRRRSKKRGRKGGRRRRKKKTHTLRSD